MTEKSKYTRSITIRVPEDVYKALEKRAEYKKKYFGKYRPADVVRTAVIKHLKAKGLLDKDKNYL